MHVHSVRAEPLPGSFGYVRITQFNDSTPDDLVQALRWLPIWAIGHNGRDRLQFHTIRPLSEKEWRWLDGLGARVFLLSETTYVLRWSR